jgi:protein-S-isoprenylcysteine O-methyltransferase Ste14
MKLDIRLPIGLLFVLIGAIIGVYGLTSGSEIYHRSLGININLWWGAVMFAFGLIMLFLAFRAHGRHSV